MSKTAKWIIRIAVAAAVVIVGAIVIFKIVGGSAPKKLTINSSGSGGTTTTALAVSGPADISGTWRPTDGSVVGYRVNEVLSFGGGPGVKNTAAGRTTGVTGSMVIGGSTISAVDLTADMTSVSSDKQQRDGQFRNRIMNVATYPTAAFKLTQPIVLDKVPADTSTITPKATGDLTLHGVTKSVTFTLTAERSGANLRINGEIPIVFADYSVNNPSGGPAQTEDHGLLEFTVVFAKS